MIKQQTGHPLLGSFVTIPSAAFVEGLGTARLDFVVIDLEHGPLSLERELDDILRACQIARIEAWIRLADTDVGNVSRLLDQGAAGFVLTGGTNVAAVTRSVEAVYFPPLGKRGLSTATRAAGYGSITPASFMERSNKSIRLVPTVESVDGLESLSELVRIKGITGVFVGLADLALSLGLQGQMDAPPVKDALRSIISKCDAAHVPVGTIARNLEHALGLQELNLQFLVLSSTLPWQIYRDTVKGLREQGSKA